MSRLLSLLGMCRRAGKLKTGFEASKGAVECGKACLIICACDLSLKTLKEINYSVEKNGGLCKVIKADFDQNALSQAIGIPAGVVAVCDKGFAKSALTLYQTGGNVL